jgi:hypothetical protein
VHLHSTNGRGSQGIASFVASIAVLGAALTAGCATNEKIKLAADGAPQYQQLQITYDLASARELQRFDHPSGIEQTAGVELAFNNQAATSRRPWTPRRLHLELQYPYPGVHPAFARATLRIVNDDKDKTAGSAKSASWTDVFSLSSTTPAKKPQPDEPSKLPAEDQQDLALSEEVLFIDLPKTELEEVLKELAKTDFFKQPSNPDGASHLLVVLNKGRCEKGWARQEHLDRLIDLLRQHGTPRPASAEPKKS